MKQDEVVRIRDMIRGIKQNENTEENYLIHSTYTAPEFAENQSKQAELLEMRYQNKTPIRRTFVGSLEHHEQHLSDLN